MDVDTGEHVEQQAAGGIEKRRVIVDGYNVEAHGANLAARGVERRSPD
jgi:hypothetical protein